MVKHALITSIQVLIMNLYPIISLSIINDKNNSTPNMRGKDKNIVQSNPTLTVVTLLPLLIEYSLLKVQTVYASHV